MASGSIIQGRPLPSSYTPRNRFTLQATGEGLNVWGNILNEGAFGLIDYASDGVAVISASGPTTLTTANGAADQARARVLNVTATGPSTITIPSSEKLYVVRAASAPVTITNGSNSLTLNAGSVAWIVTDGTFILPVRVTDLGGSRLTNVGTPTANSDAATKKYVDDASFNAVNLPAQAGNAGKFVTTNGTTASWSAVPVDSIDGLQAAIDTAAAAAITKAAVETAVGGQVALVKDQTITISGTTHTFAAADIGKVHRFTNAAGCVATIPNSLPADWNIFWSQLGAAQITFATGAGATRNNRYSHTKSSGLFAEGSLRIDSNAGGSSAIAILSGDTAA